VTTEVFCNYRTLDARYGAAASYELLGARFGHTRVFRDCVSMLPGELYPDAIRSALEQTRVLLVLVGPRWFAEVDGVRLVDNERDWVRREIRRAFERGIPVVPVLLDGVAPPGADDLPEDIRKLALCQAVPVDHRTLGRDIAALADRITDLVPELVLPDLFEPTLSIPDEPLPSMLLRAEYAVVPFVGRDRELTELAEWLATPDRAGVQLVTGPGGQGKTRLAAEVIGRARSDGWAAGFVPEIVPADVLARVELCSVPLLLVVDYAEGRTEQVAAVVAALADRPAERGPVRLLLLARSAGLWQSYLRPRDDRVARLCTDLAELRLGPLTTVLDRHGEFDRAVRAFDTALGHGSRSVTAPADLDDRRYERALDIHAVALATCLDLDAAAPGPAAGDPVARVLDHEERYWLATTDAYHLADPHLGRLRQVVAAATLFGASDTRSARALVAALPTFDGTERDRVERYRRWLGELYPGPAPLNPVRPDRLGEDLVAKVLRHEPEVALAGEPDDAQLVRALTVLGRSVARHDHLRAVLVDLLCVAPDDRLPLGMAVATRLESDTLIAVLSDLSGDDPDLTDIVVDNLPDRSLALAVFAAVRTRAALDRERRKAAPDEETLAWLAIRMSVRLAALGEVDDALTFAAEAVRRYRGLAVDPTFTSDLANALITFGGALDDVGLCDDALAAADEAVMLLRELSAADPSLREILATALMTLGNILDRLARHDDAVAALTESVGINRTLLAESPDTMLVTVAHSCATSLENLATALAGADRPEESLDAAERALAVTRMLAAQRVDEFGVDEVRGTANLSAAFAQLDRWEPAHRTAEEAVQLARDLVARHGAPHLPRLADALIIAGIALRNLDRPEEALIRTDEAVTTYRRVLGTGSGANLEQLAYALRHHGLCLADVGDTAGASAAYAESADIYRKLVDPRPDAIEPELADVLRGLADALHDLGELSEARAAADEAAELLARRVARGETDLRLGLVQAHMLRAVIRRDLDEHEGAADAAEEAVALYTAMIDAGVDVARLPLERAHALHVWGNALSADGRDRDALVHYRAAAEHYRGLRLDEPHTDALAVVTQDLAECLSLLDEPEAALEHFTEAVRLRRELLDDDPDTALELAIALYNLADGLHDLDRDEESLAPAQEALDLAAELRRHGNTDADGVHVHALVHRAAVLGTHDRPGAAAALAEALAVARGTDVEDIVTDAISALAHHHRDEA
jgi:tetratricopeptide (TPR) repeat protein